MDIFTTKPQEMKRSARRNVIGKRITQKGVEKANSVKKKPAAAKQKDPVKTSKDSTTPAAAKVFVFF